MQRKSRTLGSLKATGKGRKLGYGISLWNIN